MSLLAFARQRIGAVLDEIGRLKDADFPYSDSHDALKQIERLFNNHSLVLSELNDENDPTVIQTARATSLQEVFDHLPLLGFVLRSTNVRNSFEIFGPLLRLAQQILEDNTKLILSSEWEYSPHVYIPFPCIPDYVLLGLPACESGNPLLVPLAGHELGHTAWRLREIEKELRPIIEDRIMKQAEQQPDRYNSAFGSDVTNSLLVTQNLAPAHDLAMTQVEETFCDILGVKIFAESYLLAFAYLLSPANRYRAHEYPSMTDRITNMLKACTQFEFELPDGYASWFSDQATWANDYTAQYLLEIADAARESVVNNLIKRVDEIASSRAIVPRSSSKIEQVLNAFELATPASNIGDLPSILNAA